MKATVLNVWRFVLGMILFAVAWVLIIPATAVNMLILVSKGITLKGYFLDTATSLDRWANREYRTGLNAIMIKENGYPFGDIDETISSVLGKNQRDGTLKPSGKILCYILDTIEKDHCKKSIIKKIRRKI